MTSPALACAAAFVDELVRQGVSDFVLSPGSRSAPVALVLAERERRQHLRLHVRIDERSAGFLAVGLSRRSGEPVAVVCTSGTAVGNLLPSVLEASYSPAQLVLVTADRPAEARGCGAPQTVDQVGIFGSAVRWSVDLPAPESGDATESDAWKAAATRGVAEARSWPGPVHVNAAFRPPLVGSVPEFDSTAGAADVGETATAAPWPGVPPERGLLIVGDLPPAQASLRRQVVDLAAALGWPVIAEPTAGPLDHPNVLRHGPLVLAATGFAGTHTPDLAITVGRFGLTRSVLGVVSGARDHWAVNLNPLCDPPDPARSASVVLPGLPAAPPREPGRPAADEWLAEWLAADCVIAGVVESSRPDEPEADLTGPVAAAEARRSVAPDGLLFIGPSWPIRFLEADWVSVPGVVMANRGVNGIDGVVSSGAGAALAHQLLGGDSSVAVMGDLSFLHDHNGLVWPEGEPEPDLTYVVIDNNGGGLFSQLEQGEPEFARDFERVFGTPHGLDLVAVADAAGLPACLARTVGELRAALANGGARCATGRRVVVASVGGRHEENDRLRQMEANICRAIDNL